MVSEIMKYFDRNTVIAVIVTSIILFFYSYLIFCIYILGVIIVIIIRYKWGVFDHRKLNNAFKNIAVSVVHHIYINFFM